MLRCHECNNVLIALVSVLCVEGLTWSCLIAMQLMLLICSCTMNTSWSRYGVAWCCVHFCGPPFWLGNIALLMHTHAYTSAPYYSVLHLGICAAARWVAFLACHAGTGTSGRNGISSRHLRWSSADLLMHQVLWWCSMSLAFLALLTGLVCCLS